MAKCKENRYFADLEECDNCKYRIIETCICSTDRGYQDVSYPVCKKENEK